MTLWLPAGRPIEGALSVTFSRVHACPARHYHIIICMLFRCPLSRIANAHLMTAAVMSHGVLTGHAIAIYSV